ncbi:MAG: MATE family efflux transporter [Pirellulaceae bacterium]
MFIETTAFTIFLFQLGTLGADALAATTISFGINSLAFVPMLGLGMAVTTLVGQQLGANAPELAERATRTSFVLGAAYTSLWAAAYWFIPDVFLAAYSLGDDPVRHQEVHAMCVLLLRFIAFYSFLDMTHIVFVSAIKGAGDTRFVLLTTILIAPIPIVLGWLGTSIFHWTLVHFWMVITSWICAIGVIYFCDINLVRGEPCESSKNPSGRNHPPMHRFQTESYGKLAVTTTRVPLAMAMT